MPRAFPQSRTLATWASLLVLGYFVILGEAGELNPHPIVRIFSAAAGGTIIVAYLLMAPTRADRVDRGVLVALLLFAGAGVLAQFPRQAFDALLGALLFSAGFFLARTLLGSDAGRRGFALCLMALSATFTFLTSAWVLLPLVEWWSLNEWAVFPPLNLDFSGLFWGHRHDLTLLIVMLYPSWLLGRLTPLRAALATVVGILAFLLVLVDGSRNLWLAMAVASVTLGLAFGRRYWPSERRRQVALAVALVVLTAVLILTGILGLILERAFATESVGNRWAMWVPLTDAWLSKPFAGFGPGSFPWVLQQTDYFQTNSWAPRHPDNAFVQLLAEAGLLGVAAVTVLLLTLVPAIARGRSRAAIWVLTTFVAAGLGANPTVFGFLVAVAIAWAAYATPHPSPTGVPRAADLGSEHRVLRTPIRKVSIAAFGLVAIVWSAASVAALSHQAVRTAAADGRLDEAAAQAEVAGLLDPGMALYRRALGAAQLLQGEDIRAIGPLTQATERNPSDDLAWRTLALAHEAARDAESARIALDRALAVQRSDPTNLLLLARLQLESGRHRDAVTTLSEVVQAWPEIVSAPGWADLLPPGTTTPAVVQLALDRWSNGLPSPEPLVIQRITLATMADRDDLAGPWAEDRLGPSLGPMYVAVMACHEDAPSLLQQAPDEVRRSSVYWQLVARQAALEGRADTQAARLLEIFGGPSPEDVIDRTYNPLEETGGRFSADRWGYRRIPTEWPDYRVLPSVQAGAARWYADPLGAIHAAGLEGALTECI